MKNSVEKRVWRVVKNVCKKTFYTPTSIGNYLFNKTQKNSPSKFTTQIVKNSTTLQPYFTFTLFHSLSYTTN